VYRLLRQAHATGVRLSAPGWCVALAWQTRHSRQSA
jgi:hypothetical protein